MKVLVIIPTYNESQNIARLLKMIFALEIQGLDVLIVDDNSPDGTAQIITDMQKSESRLYMLQREKKMGLGTAYVAGFRYALENGYDLVIEMDADFSHDPNELPNFIKASKENDLTIGSRYIKGVNVINWPLSRLILSMGASLYTRLITGLPLKRLHSRIQMFPS